MTRSDFSINTKKATVNMPDIKGKLDKVVDAVRKGKAFYLLPYKEPKVWGAKGIGEYWFGAEPGKKSSVARAGDVSVQMDELVSAVPEEVLGKDVVRIFGRRMPLVKILTPDGRLSVQFHDAKNELWIVTATRGASPVIILGFSRASVEKFGEKVAEEYRRDLEAYGDALNALIDALEDNGFEHELERTKNAETAAKAACGSSLSVQGALKSYNSAKAEMEWFYNYRPVKVGDVIPIPSGTMHALGSGVEIVEPQIAGPTQSLEDGATYPVRYYFPGYEREGGQKKLDVDRVGEMRRSVVFEDKPVIIRKEEGFTVERLPGAFEDKGLEVHRITIKAGLGIDVPSMTSFHNLVALKGRARVMVKDEKYNIPQASAEGEMLIIPFSAGSYRIEVDSDAQLVDTFTPIKG